MSHYRTQTHHSHHHSQHAWNSQVPPKKFVSPSKLVQSTYYMFSNDALSFVQMTNVAIRLWRQNTCELPIDDMPVVHNIRKNLHTLAKFSAHDPLLPTAETFVRSHAKRVHCFYELAKLYVDNVRGSATTADIKYIVPALSDPVVVKCADDTDIMFPCLTSFAIFRTHLAQYWTCFADVPPAWVATNAKNTDVFRFCKLVRKRQEKALSAEGLCTCTCSSHL